jgi:hypothetical protein
MQTILTKIGDSSNLVEYWWRDEWMNLDMHRDIDEALGVEENIFRYPDHGHVLYLQVGEAVEGPTVVFTSDSSIENKFNNVAIVPAVEGRLLRFNGTLMHAVPRPGWAYLDASEGGSNLEIWTRRRPSTDPDDPERTVYRRSVLLFNTWSHCVPKDVTSEAPSGCTTIHSSEIELGNCKPCDLRSCRDESFSNSIRMRIGLLGNKERRGSSERHVELSVPANIKVALISKDPIIFPILNTK